MYPQNGFLPEKYRMKKDVQKLEGSRSTEIKKPDRRKPCYIVSLKFFRHLSLLAIQPLFYPTIERWPRQLPDWKCCSKGWLPPR
jgi:hypothetical protein